MWDIIPLIKSPYTLAAFVAALAATILWRSIDRPRRLIVSASDKRRAELVRDALEFFHVDTQNLTREQQYSLALQRIQHRARRFLIVTCVSVVALLVCAIVVIHNSGGQKLQDSARVAALPHGVIDSPPSVGPPIAQPFPEPEAPAQKGTALQGGASATPDLPRIPRVAHENSCKVFIEGTDRMQYNLREIEIPSGCTEVEVTLRHSGQLPAKVMGHDWVLARESDMSAIVNAGMAAAFKHGYLPENDRRIIAATRVVGGGESTTIKFSTTLLQEGVRYVFFCTSPGHASVMRGTFVFGGSPVLSYSDDQAAIDEAISRLRAANIAFNTPDVIDIDHSKRVALVISVAESAEQLKALISGNGPTQASRVHTSPEVQARLVGSAGLHVDSLQSDASQGLETGGVVNWSWNVTGIAEGSQSLALTITAVLRSVPGAPGKTYQVFNRSIKVYVSPWKRVEKFLKENWQWLWSVLAIPPLLPLLRRKRNDVARSPPRPWRRRLRQGT